MSIEQLEQAVIEWANDRDLYRQSTAETRFDKFCEEVCEFKEAVKSGVLEDIKMEAGDVQVTVINCLHPKGQSYVQFLKDLDKDMKPTFQRVAIQIIFEQIRHYGLTLETCLSAAYNKIKDRTGRMENGTFVRDREGE